MHSAPIALIGRTEPALRHAAMSHAEPDRLESAQTAEVAVVISRCRLLETANGQRTVWLRPGSEFTPGFYIVARPRGHQRAAAQLGDDAVCRGPLSRRQDADAALCETALQPAGDEAQDDWRVRLQQLLEVTRRYFAVPLAEFEHRALAPDDVSPAVGANSSARRAVLSASRRGSEPMRSGTSLLRRMNRNRRSNG